jgi:hypothetical protein
VRVICPPRPPPRRGKSRPAFPSRGGSGRLRFRASPDLCFGIISGRLKTTQVSLGAPLCHATRSPGTSGAFFVSLCIAAWAAMARAGPFGREGLPTSAVTGHASVSAARATCRASGLGCCDRCHRFTLWVPHHFLDALRSCQRLGGQEISSLGFSSAGHAPSAGSGLSKKQQLTWLS